ncbi:MAG: acyl-CoA/acyl-ACP dehydrogenase [Alphaproteobacteria bacterium]|nr:acyl-CoA/acyl-ACP dehydrogenase [Alphaproteobacteria bacterium]
MIDFAPTPDELAFRDRVRTFVAEHVVGRADLDQHGCFPWDLYEEAFRAGLITSMLPGSLGGGGQTPMAVVLGAEELAYGDLGVATSTFVGTLTTAALLQFGTADQQERWLRPLTTQLRFACHAFSEPEGSSNLFARPASTTARPVDGGYVLNGVKSTITNATVASVITVFARIEGGPGGLSCFVLAADAPGVSRRNPYRKLGQRASDTGEITFEEVFVPIEDRIGQPEQGMQITTRAMTRSRYGVAAMGVGAARRARDAVLAYGHSRQASSTQKLVQAQDYRFQLAEMDAAIEAARAVTWRACWEVGQGRGGHGTRLSSIAKLLGARTAVQIADQAIHLLGAQGYMEGGVVEKIARDAKVLQIYEGPEAVQKMLIADTATRLGRMGKP